MKSCNTSTTSPTVGSLMSLMRRIAATNGTITSPFAVPRDPAYVDALVIGVSRSRQRVASGRGALNLQAGLGMGAFSDAHT
jgi:hypothetical protein